MAIIYTAYAYVIFKVRISIMVSKICRTVVAAVLVITMALMLNACAEKPFRLHILANSNSTDDQQVKLKVRDAVLKVTEDGIMQCKNASDAEEYIRNNIGIILETADETLKQNGYDYQATATVGSYHFPEKSYQNVTYPEGDYEALRIILGDGKGDNWWCVIFPPLCLSEIDGSSGSSVQYTSFFAELWKNIFGG